MRFCFFSVLKKNKQGANTKKTPFKLCGDVCVLLKTHVKLFHWTHSHIQPFFHLHCSVPTQFSINVPSNACIWKFTMNSLAKVSTCCPERHGKRRSICHFVVWVFIRIIQMSIMPGESSNWLMKMDKILLQRNQLLKPAATLSGLSLMLFSHTNFLMTNRSYQEVNLQ